MSDDIPVAKKSWLDEQDEFLERMYGPDRNNWPTESRPRDCFCIECYCECHKPGRTLHHCMPCCQMCPRCGSRLKSCMRAHLKRCHKLSEEDIDKLISE